MQFYSQRNTKIERCCRISAVNVCYCVGTATGWLFSLGPLEALGACSQFIFLAIVWLLIYGAVRCNVLSRPLSWSWAGVLDAGGFQA